MKTNYIPGSVQHVGFGNTKIDKAFRVPIMIFLFFGYNYLDSFLLDSRMLHIIVNLYCLITVSTSSVIMVLNFIQTPFSPYIVITIEYVITTFMTPFASRGFRVFFSNMESIDSRLEAGGGGDEFYAKLTNMHYVYALAITVLRVMYTAVICVMFTDYCTEYPLKVIIINFVIIAVELNELPCVIVFSFIRHRMKLLLRNIENFPPGISVVVKGVDINSTNHYLSYLDIYRKLLDNLDLVAGIITPKFAVSLMCCFPKIMILLYRLQLRPYEGMSLLYVSVMAIESVQWGILACLPGFVNEQILVETEKIKIALVHQRLDCNDERTRAQISEFLAYIEARPYKYTVWRVIRVDVSLPLALLSLCTTYLIVMIQFSQRLD